MDRSAVTRAVTVTGERFAPGHPGQQVTFEMVDAVLEETCRTRRRVRVLPSRVVVYLLLAGCLLADGCTQLWHRLAAGLGGLPVTVPTASAMSQARRRLAPGRCASVLPAARPAPAPRAARLRAPALETRTPPPLPTPAHARSPVASRPVALLCRVACQPARRFPRNPSRAGNGAPGWPGSQRWPFTRTGVDLAATPRRPRLSLPGRQVAVLLVTPTSRMRTSSRRLTPPATRSPSPPVSPSRPDPPNRPRPPAYAPPPISPPSPPTRQARSTAQSHPPSHPIPLPNPTTLYRLPLGGGDCPA